MGNGLVDERLEAQNPFAGNFSSGQTGFVGFNVGGDLGWLRIVFAENPDSLTLIDYAYNNVAGQAITAGAGVALVPISELWYYRPMPLRKKTADLVKRYSALATRSRVHAPRNWTTYATAAGAALAAGSNASAAIIYGQLNDTFTLNAARNHSIETQGTGRNSVFNGFSHVSVGTFGKIQPFLSFNENHGNPGGQVGLKFQNGLQVASTRRGSWDPFVAFVKPFVSGANIGPTGNTFHAGNYFFVDLGTANGGFQAGNTTGFVGIKSGGDYGWLRLKVGFDAGVPDSVTLIDYAFDTTGAPIAAGEVAPEPGTMALAILAAGAAGIMALRKRYTATAEKN